MQNQIIYLGNHLAERDTIVGLVNKTHVIRENLSCKNQTLWIDFYSHSCWKNFSASVWRFNEFIFLETVQMYLLLVLALVAFVQLPKPWF